MTYINALSTLNVFQSLRVKLLSRGFGYRQLFWTTGCLSFIISPFADNMTTALLMFVSYYMQHWGEKKFLKKPGLTEDRRKSKRLDFFKSVEAIEYDTLLFFFGVLAAVGALQYIGYLRKIGDTLYGNMAPTMANTILGGVSSLLDNIPLMYAVLKMDKAMGTDQWLLVTLTTGVGGSLLSIDSAAGVAVMGIGKEHYTFLSHLKWTPVIALGYFCSIAAWWLITSGLR